MRDLTDGMTGYLNEAASARHLILRFSDSLNESAKQSAGFAKLTEGNSANLTSVLAESDCGRLPALNFAPEGRSL